MARLGFALLLAVAMPVVAAAAMAVVSASFNLGAWAAARLGYPWEYGPAGVLLLWIALAGGVLGWTAARLTGGRRDG